MKPDTRKKIKRRWNATPEKERERERERDTHTHIHIYIYIRDKEKGREREARQAFILILFYFLLTPFLPHTKYVKKILRTLSQEKLLVNCHQIVKILTFLFWSLRTNSLCILVFIFVGVDDKINCILNCAFRVIFLFGSLENLCIIVFLFACGWMTSLNKILSYLIRAIHLALSEQ